MVRSQNEFDSKPLPKASSATRSKRDRVFGRLKSEPEPLPITNEVHSAISFKSKLDVGRLKSEPGPLPIRNDSPSAIKPRSELALVRLKSEPFKLRPGLPGGRHVGASTASNLSSSRKEMLKASNLSHLTYSAVPTYNSPKSRTSSGSAFYSKVVARQVSQAAVQAAKRAKATLKAPQEAPQKFFPPSPDSVAAVRKINASLLGLLILGCHICMYMNL